MTAVTALKSGGPDLEAAGGTALTKCRSPRRKGDGEFDRWAVVVDGSRRGTVALRRESRSTASLRWNIRDAAGESDLGLVIEALTLVIDHAFGELGFRRVEARIPVDRLTDVRAASICGLRREGIIRGAPGETDRALLARLADDPPANSREGFIALLNAGLPTKRIIAQGLLRDATTASCCAA